jgi:hypothetical protein
MLDVSSGGRRLNDEMKTTRDMLRNFYFWFTD